MVNEVLTEENIGFLREEFQCSKEMIVAIYGYLNTKKCVKENPDSDKIYDCIYDILFDRATISETPKNVFSNPEEDPYYKSIDYVVNKALLTHYEEEAFQDLSDEFVEKVKTYNLTGYERPLPTEETTYKSL